LALILALVVDGASATVAYLRDTNKLFRAAYCAGVLTSLEESYERELPLHAAKGYCNTKSNKEECQKAYLSKLHQEIDDKNKRFTDYVISGMLNMHQDLLGEVGALIRNGADDVRKREASVKLYACFYMPDKLPF
jgi:hypothetical protein